MTRQIALFTLAFTMAAGMAFSQQNEAVSGCRAFAALSTSAYYDNVFVNLSRQGRNRNMSLTWEAWVTDDRAITGTCEADVRGTIVRFDRLAEKSGSKPNLNSQGGFNQNGGFNQTNGNQQGGFGQTGGFGQPGQTGQNGGFGGTANTGAATLDNAGRGTFNGLGMNATLDHAHLVMQNGRAVATLSAGFNRITLQGQVTRQISDREFEITIDGSDRGRATGQILLRMTPAHNEAEEIVVNGSNGRQNFSGRFNQ